MTDSMILSKGKTMGGRGARWAGIALAGLLLLLAPLANAAESGATHQSANRSGALNTAEGFTLHLKADLGSVEIKTQPQGASPVVQYSVRVETDASGAVGENLLNAYTITAAAVHKGVEINAALPTHMNRAQFWVQIEVSIPSNYNLEIYTGAGDIQTTDIGGHVLLQTDGGNITTGRINYRGGPGVSGERVVAKLETEGGHIKVQDVLGDLDAFTAGGHIMVGNIAGSVKLRTGGGHIRAGQIKGTAQLETDGGNITVGEAGAYVSVRTGGGQIDFGEVHGSVHAQTGGGGIRVIYVSGPMEVATSGGSICLTRITNTVHAETGDGSITAWISPESAERSRPVRLPGPSQLTTGTGDLVVFLPRNIAATIDATVENGGPQRIEADPALSLNMKLRQDGQLHALGSLNGGGSVLRLKTTSGKIRLHYLDEDNALRNALLEEQRSRIARKLSEAGFDQVTVTAQLTRPGAERSRNGIEEPKSDWESLVNRFEITFLGGLREDPDEFKKHLLVAPDPEYPQLARRAGLQGLVRLQVRLKTDGSLVVEKVLEGQPALVEAANSAIQQWRATPGEFSGKKVDVISTVTFNFQLR